MNKKAFTLVELLVVMTVLSILATISFIYFFNSFAETRDSSRLSDLNNMVTNLELYYTQESKLPIPDTPVEIEYQWSVAWTQWLFWSGVVNKIKNFWLNIPKDPKFEIEYAYSVTNNEKEYQIWALFEKLKSDDSQSWIAQTNSSIPTALVKWNFNQVMVRAIVWSDYHYIASPSIIASDLSSLNINDIITQRKLVYSEFFNLPSSYFWLVETNNWFNFNVSDPIIYTGSVSNPKTKDGLDQFVNKLRYIYATTPTESFDKYISFLQEDWVNKIKKFLKKQYNVDFPYSFSCNGLLLSGDALENWFYNIDPDGDGPLPVQEVYCDIWDDNKAWTRIDGSHLGPVDGTFWTWTDISTYYHTLYNTYGDTSIISLANPSSSWFVWHLVWDQLSNYEVHFDDFTVVDAWDKIRMTLWVTDESDGWWSNTTSLNPKASYMFHNRIYYTDGTFSINWVEKVLETVNIWWKVWKKIRVEHIVKKTPQSFAWYIWLDAEDIKDLYFSWVELELYRF